MLKTRHTNLSHRHRHSPSQQGPLIVSYACMPLEPTGREGTAFIPPLPHLAPEIQGIARVCLSLQTRVDIPAAPLPAPTSVCNPKHCSSPCSANVGVAKRTGSLSSGPILASALPLALRAHRVHTPQGTQQRRGQSCTAPGSHSVPRCTCSHCHHGSQQAAGRL